jgi:hypothetical protein
VGLAENLLAIAILAGSKEIILPSIFMKPFLPCFVIRALPFLNP